MLIVSIVIDYRFYRLDTRGSVGNLNRFDQNRFRLKRLIPIEHNLRFSRFHFLVLCRLLISSLATFERRSQLLLRGSLATERSQVKICQIRARILSGLYIIGVFFMERWD